MTLSDYKVISAVLSS